MKNMKAKYVRVSTTDQNVDRQMEFEGEVFFDQCSGAIPFSERNAGKRIIELIQKGKLRELHAHSLDRMGRDTVDILNTIKFLSSNQCALVLEKEGIRTLNADGKENIASKLLISILGAVAETERALIRERQREGIAIAKRKGKFKGRKKGTSISDEDLIIKYKKVATELQAGESLRRAAALGGVSLGTAQRVSSALYQMKVS
jgi:DNA invertase Pin-like site-specific DNA recombinase